MCGIAGYIGDNQASLEIREMLERLDYRGYDSAGIAVINGKLTLSKDIGKINQVNIPFAQIKGKVGIGHTRWATHGEVSVANAHPHLDCSGKLAIVHNGIIENYLELKSKLDGHNFVSDTDSEVIAHLIEENIAKGFDYAFCIAIKQLVGSFAIVACHSDYPDVLLVARNDSPLLIGISKYGNYVTSDIEALNGNVDRLIDCVDTRYYIVRKDKVTVSVDNASQWQYDTVDGIKVDHSTIQTSKNGYPHFMAKEIYEQPLSFNRVLDQDRSRINGVAMDILRSSNVIITACGTSRYASIVGRYLISKLAHKFTEVVVGSELHYFNDSFDNRTLLIAVSQSGETADVLQGVKLAKSAGCKVISIINKPYSLLERVSDVTLFMRCGTEVAVASTKAFTNELALFYLIAFAMSNQLELGIKELETIPAKIDECLQSNQVNKLSNILRNKEHLYFIGKGINFAVAGECALKLKEVSYLHAESMSAGELKHGTLSLIEHGTPVVALCPNDYTYKETISNLYEAKARGALIIGISDKDNQVFDHWLKIPEVRDIYYPLVCVIIGQLLAYYTAVNKGLDPDKPRNLAKSVTVK